MRVGFDAVALRAGAEAVLRTRSNG